MNTRAVIAYLAIYVQVYDKIKCLNKINEEECNLMLSYSVQKYVSLEVYAYY